MAPKKLTPQQQRDKRSKMILIGLSVFFVIVMAVELPSLMGGSKKASSAPPAVTTTGATTTPAAPGTAAATSSASLAAAVVATPQPGQLHKFSRFGSKDPFHPLVSAVVVGSSGGTGPGGKVPPAKTPILKPQTPKTVTFAGQPPSSTTPATATGPMGFAVVRKLNGHRVVVPVGTEFPAANPVFKLVAVGRKAMWISLVGGSFGSGDQALKVELGHPVKLVNTTVDASFVLNLLKMKLVPKPAAPPAPATPTTTSTSTTATTTSSTPTTTN